MVNRKLLLKGMLGALGLAACAGVLALLMPGTDVVWRVAGSAVVAAIACGVMVPMSAMAGKPAMRVAGMWGMWLCVLEFLLGTAMVWGDLFGSRMSETIGLLALMLALCGLPAVAFLREMNRPGWRVASIAGCAGMLAALCVLGMASVNEGLNFFRTTTDRLWPTGWSAAIAGLLVPFCLVGVGKQDTRWWRWIGVGAAVAGLASSVWGIWKDLNGDPAWVVGPDLLGLCVAHAIVCLQPRFAGWQKGVQVAAILAMAATTAIVVAAVHLDHSEGGADRLARFAVAMGIIAASATMALAVFVRMNRKVDVELTPAAEIKIVTIVCPRCEKKQVMAVGGAMCSGCKLYIKIEVRGASCAVCGYDLSNLSADRCPECGTVIPAQAKAE